jgi:hypothetical protein
MIKKFGFLLSKRKMGTGIGGIHFEGKGRKLFQPSAACQYSRQKYIPLTLCGPSSWTVLDERQVKGRICTPVT